MINLAQLTALQDGPDAVDGGAEAIHHADIQNAVVSLCRRLHFQCLLGVEGDGLFTQDMLAVVEKIDGHGRVEVVWQTDGNSLQRRIVQDIVIIGHGFCFGKLKFFPQRLGFFRLKIHQIPDIGQPAANIRGDMGVFGDIPAADDGHDVFFHDDCLFLIIRSSGLVRARRRKRGGRTSVSR